MSRFTLFEVFLIWVIGFGTVSLLARRVVAAWVSRLCLPRIAKYYAIATPLILLEESLTIEVPYLWGIVPIAAAFYILFLPLYVVQRYSRCSYRTASLLFGIWGCFNEFILVGRIHQVQSALILLILGALCFMIYAVMAILPSYYLQKALEQTVTVPTGKSAPHE